MKKLAVFDIEVLRNCFLCCYLVVNTGEVKTIEISDRKNEIREILKLFMSGQYIFVGYNNSGYDTPIINYILKNYHSLLGKEAYQICAELQKMSSQIINGEEISWIKYKYANYFKQIDLLTMLFSKALRVSLKEMQVTMCFPNVQEMECDWNADLPVEEIDALIGYCHNDVLSTTALLKLCKSELQLRKEIQGEYNIDCLSKDGVGLGAELLKIEYCKISGENRRDMKPRDLPDQKLKLSECIAGNIKYNSPILNKALEVIKDSYINIGKGVKSEFAYQTIYDGVKFNYGLGGMHSVNNKEIHREDDDFVIIDADVDSYYPSMIIEYGFYPKHLGEIFREVYRSKRDERLVAKKLAKSDPAMRLKSDVFKLLLNSTFGNMGMQYSWLFDPKEFFSITLTGQLAIMMLNEWLVGIGCKIVSSNTDGTTVKVPRAKIDEYYKVCKAWSDYTKLGLDFAQYESMFIYAVNDYIAVKSGYSKLTAEEKITKKNDYIKEKGVFLRSARLGKGLDSLIIAKSLVDYFVDGIPVEKTITESANIWDFIRFEKTGRQFQVYWNNKKQQRTNRYYVSKKGAYLYKSKPVEKVDKNGAMSRSISMQNMLDGFAIQIFNVYEKKEMKDYNINYTYYISKAKKIVNDMEPSQLTLF
jgi:hypothetical protein